MGVLTMIKRFLSIVTALLITLGSGTASSYVFFTNIVKVLASETISQEVTWRSCHDRQASRTSRAQKICAG